jgi:hypothetical protein
MPTQISAVSLFQPQVILWTPSNPQGDTAGTRKDVKEIIELLETEKTGSMSLMVDVSRAEIPNLEQKKIIATAGKKFKFKKIAVYGFTWRMKLAVAFISKLAGGLDIKLFNNQAEALLWLEQKK